MLAWFVFAQTVFDVLLVIGLLRLDREIGGKISAQGTTAPEPPFRPATTEEITKALGYDPRVNVKAARPDVRDPKYLRRPPVDMDRSGLEGDE